MYIFLLETFFITINKVDKNLLLNSNDSEMINISSGVLQGCILGPILFLLSFNDLLNSTLLKLLLFSDDTSILASGKNLNE